MPAPSTGVLFLRAPERLLFGMSLPTSRNDLAKVYEPNAPAPSQRLATLQAARDAGLHVYVAVAPTYPECDEADLYATLEAIKPLNPVTIFHEPINIRAENVERIAAHAARVGVKLRMDVFATRDAWQDYALGSLKSMHRVASEVGLRRRFHLWPDRSLGTTAVINRIDRKHDYVQWLDRCWNRISEWPKAA